MTRQHILHKFLKVNLNNIVMHKANYSKFIIRIL
jgi:hypothetical protein